MGTLEKEWIEIQGYKHDGGMHRIWDSAYCLVDNDKYFAVCSKKVKVIEHDFRIRYTKEPAIMIFFKDSWFNVLAMFKKTGITYYVNLASPYIIENKKLKYIDYDLDLKLYPNNEIKIIDVKEYGFNKKKYNYGDDIEKILKFNVKKIKLMMENRTFPFNEEDMNDLYKTFLSQNKKEGK